MKTVKIILLAAFIIMADAAFSQNDCGLDLAKIMSGSYSCTIKKIKYGGEDSEKKGTVKIEKIGQNKVSISTAGCPSYSIEISKNGDGNILGDTTIGWSNIRVMLILNSKLGEISGQNSSGTEKEGDVYWSFTGDGTDSNKPESMKFIAQNVKQLDCHLEYLKENILGMQYSGTLVRAINKKFIVNGTEGVPLKIFSGVEDSWQRYDIKGQKALYFGETIAGNKTEISYYGDWVKGYQVWEWSDIVIDNLLDLTDAKNLEILGVTLELLNTGIDSRYDRAPESDKMYNYEFTNALSTWARTKKYKGLIVPGARGNKDYRNIVLFEQADINAIFSGKKGKIVQTSNY